jgi:hypothetical protein
MIIIGCPVYKRDWILDEWFHCIENQTVPLSELGFLFELGPEDEETHNVLWNWHTLHPEVSVFDGVIRMDEKHKAHPEESRTWCKLDYYKMVNLRNNLLERVNLYNPDRYFSLDSDILLTDTKTIERLAEITESGGAVNPLMYMFPKGVAFPSVMSWVDNSTKVARRLTGSYPIGTLFRSDVIMAAKMMSKPVYENVRYIWHRQGEDLGWSSEAKRLGHELWCSSDIYAEHILHRYMLEQWREGTLESRAAI